MKYVCISIAAILLISFNYFSNNKDAIKIEVIKQQTVKNDTHQHLSTKEIEFRITNKSKKTVYIKGTQTIDKFFPTGFFAKYDGYKKKWKTPFKENKIPNFEGLEVVDVDNNKLEPNESLTFTDLLPPTDQNIKYKRIIYISIKEPQSKPKTFESPLFAIENAEELFN